MQPNEMRALLRKEPFRPFRLYLTDGRIFDIRVPCLNLAADDRLVVGWTNPNTPDSKIADDYMLVDWSEIAKWEYVTPPVSA